MKKISALIMMTIDARENEGRTDFDIAASAGNDSVMDILLQAGAAP